MPSTSTEQSKSVQYTDIEEAAELLEDHCADELHVPGVKQTRRQWTIWVTIISLICLNAAFWWFARRGAQQEQNMSGFFEGLDRSWHIARDNPFEKYNAFTAAWQEQGDYAEERWWDLGTYSSSLIIPEKYAADFGLNRSKHTFVTFESSPGIPHEGYPATLMMVHNLHCINFLWQGLYFNHEYYRKIQTIGWNGSEGHEDRLRVHLLHCVDSLRQSALCEADVRVHPYLKETHGAFGDFNLPHKCRNWAAVRDFARDPKNGFAGIEFHKIDNHHTEEMEGVERWSEERLWRGL